jgi:hypothetical protein
MGKDAFAFILGFNRTGAALGVSLMRLKEA